MVIKDFQVCSGTFFRKIKKSLAEIRLVLTKLVANKNIKRKRKFSRQSVS